MKLVTKFIRSQLELTKSLSEGAPLDTVRDMQDRVGRLMHFTRRHDVVVLDNHIDTPHASLIVPRDELRGGVIIYLHGGGYVGGSIEYSKGYASVLAAECGMRTLSVEYRLAPENPYPAALEDALAAYRATVREGVSPEKIILAGESAGGGLAYALALKLRDLGEAGPAGIIAISPWVDLTLSGESYQTNRKSDPSLTRDKLKFYADCYVGADYCLAAKNKKALGKALVPPELEEKKKNPYISPLFADLTGICPSIIFAGEDEILLDDARCLADKLAAVGSEVQLVTRTGMWHAYVLYGLSENRHDYDKINHFIRCVMPRGNERKLKWMPIDNVGKIYPASRTANWYNVFRLSMTLTEAVDREVLQSALDVTVRRFPSIAVRLRRGMFWYYLEEIAHAPKIQDEKAYPLVRMPFDDVRHCAFRVIVYRNRIACEFFHSITDGNGALVFLKSLVAEYLTEKYGAVIPAECGVLDRLEMPKEEEYTDLFPRYKGPVGKSRSEKDSYRIKGTPEDDGFCHITTFMLNTAELKERAHSMGVTVTALLSAAFTLSLIGMQHEDTSCLAREKEVKVLLPVDLRRIYGVNTLRNFMLYVYPSIDPRLGDYTLEEIAGIIQKKMQLEVTEKNMSAMITTNMKDEENRFNKIAPLFLKNLVMKIFFLIFGERKSSMTLSNLGVVKLPDEMERYVERMDFNLATQASGPYNAAVITYRDTAYLNIVRNIKEPRLEGALYRILRDEGIHVKLESNER